MLFMSVRIVVLLFSSQRVLLGVEVIQSVVAFRKNDKIRNRWIFLYILFLLYRGYAFK